VSSGTKGSSPFTFTTVMSGSEASINSFMRLTISFMTCLQDALVNFDQLSEVRVLILTKVAHPDE
jgi:hypothetical protein